MISLYNVEEIAVDPAKGLTLKLIGNTSIICSSSNSGQTNDSATGTNGLTRPLTLTNLYTQNPTESKILAACLLS